MSGGLYVKLDADYAEDPKIIRAGVAAELLYIRMLALCARKFTDGFVPAELIPSMRLQHPARRLSALLRETLIARVDGGYQVTAWHKHNRSAASIAAERDKKSSGSNHANHLRWHIQMGRFVPECVWCQTDRQPPSGRSDKGSDIGSDGESDVPPVWDSIDSTSDPTSDPTPAPASSSSDDPIPVNSSQEDDRRLVAVVGLLARRETDNASAVRNPGGYERAARKRIQTERGDEIKNLLHDRPSANVETLVDLLERDNGYYGAVVPAGTATLTQPPDKPRSNNQSPWSRRDPEWNRKMIESVGDEIAELGMSYEIPEPVRGSWVENPAPPPPELMARARHQEDEIMEVAS